MATKPINAPGGGGKSGSPTQRETTSSPRASMALVIAWISIVLDVATAPSSGLSRGSSPPAPAACICILGFMAVLLLLDRRCWEIGRPAVGRKAAVRFAAARRSSSKVRAAQRQEQ